MTTQEKFNLLKKDWDENVSVKLGETVRVLLEAVNTAENTEDGINLVDLMEAIADTQLALIILRDRYCISSKSIQCRIGKRVNEMGKES